MNLSLPDKMFSYLYKLAGKIPVQCKTVSEWDQDFLCAYNIIKHSELNLDGQYIQVITEFTGYDFGKGEMFQTIILGGEHSYKTFKCATWQQAEAQHEEALLLVFS